MVINVFVLLNILSANKNILSDITNVMVINKKVSKI